MKLISLMLLMLLIASTNSFAQTSWWENAWDKTASTRAYLYFDQVYDMPKLKNAHIPLDEAARIRSNGVTWVEDIIEIYKNKIPKEIYVPFLKYDAQSYDVKQSDVDSEHLLNNSGYRPISKLSSVFENGQQYQLKNWTWKNFCEQFDYRRSEEVVQIEKYFEITFDQIDQDRLNPVSFDLGLILHNSYHGSRKFNKDDQSILAKEMRNLILQKNIQLHSLEFSELIEFTATIVADKLTWKDVDLSKEFAHLQGENVGLLDYWKTGDADCDKYAALFKFAFHQVKKMVGKKLQNVYVADEFFNVTQRHAWNTLIIVNSNGIIFSPVDPTFYDEHYTQEKLNAYDSWHLNPVQVYKGFQATCRDTRLRLYNFVD